MVVVEVVLDGRTIHQHELAPYPVPTPDDQYAADVRTALADDGSLNVDDLTRAEFKVKLAVGG